MAVYRLSGPAQTDIEDILAYSQEQFGLLGRQRYQALIVAGLRDVLADPRRSGSIDRPELGANVRTWHLRHSRSRVSDPPGAVKTPRHMLVYREEPGGVGIGRVLHDAMELAKHMESPDTWA